MGFQLHRAIHYPTFLNNETGILRSRHQCCLICETTSDHCEPTSGFENRSRILECPKGIELVDGNVLKVNLFELAERARIDGVDVGSDIGIRTQFLIE